MLWLASLMVENWPDRGEHHGALNSIEEFVPKDGDAYLDGSVSAFSAVPEEHREGARRRVMAAGGLTDEFANALSFYPACPARWLLDDWLAANAPDQAAAEDYLKKLVLRMRDGRSSYATQLRANLIVRAFRYDKLSFGPERPGLIMLRDYPRNLSDEDRKTCESIVRASLGALMGAREDKHPIHTSGWAAQFWRHNRQLSKCERRTPLLLTDEDEPDEELPDGDPPLLVSTLRDGFLAAIGELEQKLQELQEQAEMNLYEPVTDEVRMGLASRQLRLLRRLVENPTAWTHERSPHLIRPMIDTRIVAAWLVFKNDPALYERYKDYGQGKLKLLKLNFEEHIEQQGGFTETSQEYLDYLEMRVNIERDEEFQGISLKPNFGDRSIRQMAEDVGLKDLYDLNYSPLSGESHGDWGSLVTHDLERCSNPLHRYHRLGRFAGGEEELRLDYLYHAVNLMDDTVEAIFESYGLQTADVLDRFRALFAKALDAAAGEEDAGEADAATDQ
jgi:hypothetical protein